MHRDLSQETWPPKHLPAKPTEESDRWEGASRSPHQQDIRQIGLKVLTERLGEASMALQAC